MSTISGYQILEQIYESEKSLVYRGLQNQDAQPMILKVLKQEYPTPEEIARFKLEYEIIRNLNLDGVVRPYGLERYKNSLILLLEDFGGKSLKFLMSDRRFSLGEFLTIAIRLADILGTIHQQNIMHKDINPSNTVFNPETGQLKIIDFGISTVLSRENQVLQNPHVIEGTLAYMSPEQTGRMNRAIDYRTDFYSLGATFYELLTYQLLFETTDAMELVHCHIAKQPIPPHLLSGGVEEIPKAVSNIVMKLLAKTAEERYQSAWGIKADLEECLTQLQTRGTISNFPLGRYDISDKFQIPEKLYGRESEVEALMAAFERVSQGTTEMMLVAGFSGIGKSVLVQEVHKPIVRQRGYFIWGKFDQFKRNIPFASLVQAFQDLIRQLLTESQAQIAAWKAKLLDALGLDAQVLIDVIPEIELIIGKQPPVTELSPTASQNRFNLLFQKFIRVFTQAKHPLVIFLDDLQWADNASLKLLELLMNDSDTRYLLLIGAYRDNEVNPVHPLMITLEKIRNLRNNGQEACPSVNQIVLAPLDLTNLNRLIADALHCFPEQSKPLAELVLSKTEGNPFFTNQFLKSLYQEGVLKFTPPLVRGGEGGVGGWQWDIAQARTMAVADNVVEFMAEKLQKLEKKTQQVLKLAACIGNQFDLVTLAVVYEKSVIETATDLWESLQEGLILPLSDTYKFFQGQEITDAINTDNLSVSYKFLHDRVQQAAYSLISDADKQSTHLKIGHLFLDNTISVGREEKIFDIVNQLNFGIELITQQSKKNELAQLNLIAGRKAKAATAYAAAVKYLTVGMELLVMDSWETQYELTLAIYAEAAGAEYLNTNFEQAERLAEHILQQAKSLLDRVKVYELKMQIYMAQAQMLKTIDTGLQALEMLGVALFTPSDGNLLVELPTLSDLDSFPEMADPYKKAAMRILITMSPAAYVAKPEILLRANLTMVNLSVEQGHSLWSSYAYAVYGLLLCGALGEVEAGYHSGKLALRLLEQFDAKELKCKVNFIFNVFIRHWKEPARKTKVPLMETVQMGLETGDLEYASFAAQNYCYYLFFVGEKLETLERQQAQYVNFILKIKQQYSINNAQIWRQCVLNLMGRDEERFSLIGESFNESEMLPIFRENNNRSSLFNVYLAKAILCYLFQDYTQTVTYASYAEEYAGASLGSIHSAAHKFYYSLALLAQYPHADTTKQQQYLEQVTVHQEKMKYWAEHSPWNFQHKYDLVEAEKARILGNPLKAMEDYDKAIQGAKDSRYIQDEALAYERAAEFYQSLGRDLITKAYILEAHYAYLKWGATAKLRALEEKYPQFLPRASEKIGNSNKPRNTTRDTTATSGSPAEALDLTTVMKASQAIASEIVLDKLLSKLMKILIENAGAQKGFLILKSNGQLLIEAEGSVERDSVTVLQSIVVERSSDGVPPILPTAIINYVARTKENVVLNDATHEGQFTNDLYISQNQPKSILCAPLINQGKLISIVYLENNLTTGAFTPDRFEVLKLLASQAAISIDLAKLYSEVRSNESRLTQFLEAMPVGVGILDASGKPYYTNHMAIQLLGKGVVPDTSSEQLTQVYQLYKAGTNELYPREEMSIIRALRGEKSALDDMEIHKGDQIIPIETWGTPIFDEKGNIAYAIVAFQDITERKKAETERLKFTQELFQLNQAFARFVPRQFLQFLDKESIVDVQLGDQVQQEMSVFFADIRNFTTLSESLTPQENFKFINAYLSRMEPVIIEHQGFIDKYIGDAIMALFSGGADNAVKAAIAMLYRLAEYNQYRTTKGYVPIKIGIGINTGSLMLGTVGGYNRMDSTVISDAVNLASRIEDLTKNYGVSLLISHHTFLQLEDANQYAFRIIERLIVKGKSSAVTVFEVFDADDAEIRKGKLTTKQDFEQALLLYNLGNLAEAAQGFQKVLSINPSDTVAQIYLERCQE
ncbi:MAG: AAA family ATPase [Cyanobacteriota bacterium]